jgi:hypothetical protein
MVVTHSQSVTRLGEIADGVHRISTPLSPHPALTFNPLLVLGNDEGAS